MATRGSLGGLAPATADVVRVLDAIGYDVIFVETVGTGQAEVDVVGAADTVVIVLVPGLGDTVQTMKAGIMEIGEVFVVNKADQGDADRTVTEVTMMLTLHPRQGAWQPAVLRTVASGGEGVEEVRAAIEAHRAAQERTGALESRRHRRRRDEILRRVEVRVKERALEAARRSGRLDELTAQVAAGTLDPHSAAEEILKDL
jgi:LAO/AO transport system kinase